MGVPGHTAEENGGVTNVNFLGEHLVQPMSGGLRSPLICPEPLCPHPATATLISPVPAGRF